MRRQCGPPTTTVVVREDRRLIVSHHRTFVIDNSLESVMDGQQDYLLSEPTTGAAERLLAGMGYRVVEWCPIDGYGCVASARIEANS